MPTAALGVDAAGVVGVVLGRHDVQAGGVASRGLRKQAGSIGETGFEAQAESGRRTLDDRLS